MILTTHRSPLTANLTFNCHPERSEGSYPCHGAGGRRKMCGGERVPLIPYRNVTNIKKHNLC